jgi:hypothetical protein
VLQRIAVCILLLSACSSGGDTTANESASTASLGGSTTVETHAADSLALDCRDPIAEMPAPDAGYEVIGDAVAIVTSRSSKAALQTREAGDANASQRLYAKNAVLVRRNTRSEFIVPTAWRNRLSFRWGNAGPQEATEHLVVGPCNSAAEWMVFPGGYFVAENACVQFIVRAADEDHEVSVGVGAPCAGQDAPAEPTEK